MERRSFLSASAFDVVQSLTKLHRTVAAAESCTGGMFASALISIPGCSEVLSESYITYSDEAKRRILGVSESTLQQYTAVSEQCAREMAEGVRKISGAYYGIGITGYAGPGGGTQADPVGTVYISVAGPDRTVVYCIHCEGDRDRIRKVACMKTIILLRSIISLKA